MTLTISPAEPEIFSVKGLTTTLSTGNMRTICWPKLETDPSEKVAETSLVMALGGITPLIPVSPT